MSRPPREAYACLDLEWEGWNIVPGLELRPDDDFAWVTAHMRRAIRAVCASLRTEGPMTAQKIAQAVESALTTLYPDRGYFLEVEDVDHTWVQLWQPPTASRCVCGTRFACPIHAGNSGLDKSEAFPHLLSTPHREHEC